MARLEWTSWPLRMRVRVSPSFPHRGSRVAGWWVVDRSRVYEPTVASLYAFVRVVATPPTSASPTGVTAYLAVHRCVALVCFLFPLRFAKKTSNIQKCVLSTRVVQWVSFRFVVRSVLFCGGGGGSRGGGGGHRKWKSGEVYRGAVSIEDHLSGEEKRICEREREREIEGDY